MDWFGLGILVEVRDLATRSLNGITQALDNARGSSESFSERFNNAVGGLNLNADNLRNTMMAGFGMQQAGDSFTKVSKAMLHPLVDVGKQVVSTSSQFENWRKTLKALYKDQSKANEKLQWGMKLAAETPFEMTDVTSALIGFKAIGVEADTTLTSVNGVKQSMMEFIGDLASLRPDVGMQGVMMGVRNLIGGDGGKSLRMRMDMDLENILGREFGDTPEQLMQDLADISGKVANGLMGELEGTWTQIISNLKDQATRFFLALGDAGMFDGIKRSLQAFSNIIGSIDDNKMAKIGKNMSEAFNMIWKPIDLAIRGISKLISVIINLVASNSLLGKVVGGFLALGGVITGVVGIVLKLGGGLLVTISSFGLFLLTLQNSNVTFQMIRGAMMGMLSTIGKLALGFGIALAVWKADIGGIRTITMNMVNTISNAFKESTKISEMGVKDMMQSISKLDMNNFGDRLTYRLTQIKVFWMALCEAWNSYELSDDTFRKVQELGLLPLLETVLDFKMRFESFWKGFTSGFKGVVEVIVSVCNKVGEAVGKVVNFLSPITEKLKGTKREIGEGLKLDGWEKAGKIIGVMVSVFGAIAVVGKIVAVVWGALTSVFSVVATVISGAISVITAVVSFLAPVFGAVASVISTVASVLAGLSPIVWVVVAVIGALIGVVVLLKNNWQQVCEWWTTGWNNMLSSAQQLGSQIQQAFSSMGQALGNIVKTASNFVINAWTTMVSSTKSILSQVGSAVKNAFSKVSSTISSSLSKAWKTASSWWSKIKSIFSNPIKAVVNFVKTGDVSGGGGGKKKGGSHANGLYYVPYDGYMAELHKGERVLTALENKKLQQKGATQVAINLPTSDNKGSTVMATPKETPQEQKIVNNFSPTLNPTPNNPKGQSDPPQQVDNSVTFSEGSIQITVNDGKDFDAKKYAKQIMEEIKREQQLRNTLQYKTV